MRMLFLAPLLLLGACNVTTDKGNNQVTVQYNEEAAQDAASDVGNTAEDMGAAIANEADRLADKVDNSGIVADGGDDSSNTADNRQ